MIPSVRSTPAQDACAAFEPGGRHVLDGKESFAITEPLKVPLGEKTLEAWVALSTLEQGGGGVVSVEADNGQRFDAIVFGERQLRQWMAGSDSFRLRLAEGVGQ